MKNGFLDRLAAGWRRHGHCLLPQLAALMLVATLPLPPAHANMPGTFQPMLLAQAPSGGALNCSGGTITTSGPNRIHTFMSSGTLVCTGSGAANYLVVGGGGAGGGGSSGGGGGAGGLLTGAASLVPGSFVITVGAG